MQQQNSAHSCNSHRLESLMQFVMSAVIMLIVVCISSVPRPFFAKLLLAGLSQSGIWHSLCKSEPCRPRRLLLYEIMIRLISAGRHTPCSWGQQPAKNSYENVTQRNAHLFVPWLFCLWGFFFSFFQTVCKQHVQTYKAAAVSPPDFSLCDFGAVWPGKNCSNNSHEHSPYKD